MSAPADDREVQLANAALDAAAPLRLLCLSRREPRWTLFSLNMQELYGGSLRLEWIADAKSAITKLHGGGFDAVLLGETSGTWSGTATDILDFLDALQTVDATIAVVALLPMPDDALLAELHARDCAVCVSPRLWDSPALPAVIAGAIRRQQHQRDSERLAAAHQRRLVRDQADAATMLRLQHDLLRNLQLQGQEACSSPSTWAERYDELLKASILSGPKRLSNAIGDFVTELFTASQRPLDVLTLHVDRVEALSAELGGRTSQHLVARADLLALHILAELGERYRALVDGLKRAE